MRSRIFWIALAIISVTTLFIGSRPQTSTTTSAKVNSIAKEVRCPVCESQSVADSDANAAKAVKAEIRRRVVLGQSSSGIKAYLASRYGNDILLEPSGSGISWLVWALPVFVIIVGAGFVFVRMFEWQDNGEVKA